MKWEKKGLIYKPNGSLEWSKTHAQIPVPIKYNQDTLRIFFATRNTSGETQTGFIDVDIDEPKKVKKIAQEPVIKTGKAGFHDDSGAMPFCILKREQKYMFYYSGWHIPRTVSYDLSIGLCHSENLNSFEKVYEGPLFSKNKYEPFWAAAPMVIFKNNIFRMWYISCYDWIEIYNKLEPVYNIKTAYSENGIDWDLNFEPVIKEEYYGEALGRPWVIYEENKYKMWFSKRGSKNYRSQNGEHYEIGYAESEDGLNWERLDQKAGINKSNTGWDSEMIEYASIYKDSQRKYMFYNGNGFGKSGFGYAEAK